MIVTHGIRDGFQKDHPLSTQESVAKDTTQQGSLANAGIFEGGSSWERLPRTMNLPQVDGHLFMVFGRKHTEDETCLLGRSRAL